MKKLTKEMLENEGYNTTSDLERALYILHDGHLWDGFYTEPTSYGRLVEHREIEAFLEYDRYDCNFWDKATKDLKIVQIIPETKDILIFGNQKITSKQVEKIQEFERKGYLVVKEAA